MDPRQPPIFFSKETKKKYRHMGRHQANARFVAKDKYEIRMGKLDEIGKKVFVAAFNMGYEQGRKRSLELEKKTQQYRTQDSSRHLGVGVQRTGGVQVSSAESQSQDWPNREAAKANNPASNGPDNDNHGGRV